MDKHINKYYSVISDEAKRGNFYEVIPLHERRYQWDDVVKIAPSVPKGWYELSQLSKEDRVEFTRQFWMSKILYHPKLESSLSKFFEGLDDIGVFVLQKEKSDSYFVEMVYSLSENCGFFRGSLPATEDEIVNLEQDFSDFVFPEDYLIFLQIHNGFWKATDTTGIIPVNQMKLVYDGFQLLLAQKPPLVIIEDQVVDIKALIPFYESFGMPFFQCFWAEWYPINEMGNVYYSEPDHTISDFVNKGVGTSSLAFSTFIDWLMFYLEQIT